MQTPAEERVHFRQLLAESAGTHWRFEHCGCFWDVREGFRPVAVCPECGDRMTSKRLFPLNKEVPF